MDEGHVSAPISVSSILIVEDRPDDLAFITDVLRSAFGPCEVRSARTLARARQLVAQDPPDFVILDLHLPDGAGGEMLPVVRAKRPDATVVVVTVFDDDEHLFAALQAGADGYLLKDESRASASAILKDVLEGHPPLSARVARRVLKHVQSTAPRSSSALELTNREREVLVLLARGHTIGVAAAQLGISEHTVKTHVKSLYRKLDVSTRAGLVRTAIDEGLA
ncbi:MAG: response regulator transcription factor [Kofleriaceae bacterium]|nr:response regulator transcription factor [Kofleriaceae bacterium]